jgi:hypothetical protein
MASFPGPAPSASRVLRTLRGAWMRFSPLPWSCLPSTVVRVGLGTHTSLPSLIFVVRLLVAAIRQAHRRHPACICGDIRRGWDRGREGRARDYHSTQMRPFLSCLSHCVCLPCPAWSDGMFRVGRQSSSVVTDDQLVAALSGRGALATPAGLEFVFLNACNSLGVCRRIQDECSVPVVVGWNKVAVPAQQCFVMVRGGGTVMPSPLPPPSPQAPRPFVRVCVQAFCLDTSTQTLPCNTHALLLSFFPSLSRSLLPSPPSGSVL